MYNNDLHYLFVQYLSVITIQIQNVGNYEINSPLK